MSTYDQCPTCGKDITDTDEDGTEREDGQRWCIIHYVEHMERSLVSITNERDHAVRSSAECANALETMTEQRDAFRQSASDYRDMWSTMTTDRDTYRNRVHALERTHATELDYVRQSEGSARNVARQSINYRNTLLRRWLETSTMMPSARDAVMPELCDATCAALGMVSDD